MIDDRPERAIARPRITKKREQSLNNEMHSEVNLSVVIPAYNEAPRIPSTLRQILDYLNASGDTYEVLVVDDGSTDGTAELVEAAARETAAVRLVRNPGNRGKGYAVRNGMLNARGEYLLFSDADLSAPIAEADRLLGPLRGGYEVVIGSRALKREWIGVHQSGLRETAGKIFNFCIRAMTGLRFSDTQCGFKAFRRQAAQIIFSKQRTHGFGFDVEVLYLARKFGLCALEVPVHWNHGGESKIHMLRDSTRMFVDILRVRWN